MVSNKEIFSSIEARIKAATVIIYDQEDISNFGTGFFVAKDKILTCKHVTSSMKKVVVEDTNTPKKWIIKKPSIKYSKKHDLALISLVKPSTENSIILFDQGYEVFDPIVAWGFSLLLQEDPEGKGDEDSFNGKIEAILKQRTHIKFKEGDPVEGFSGSALVSLKTGFAIGIIPYKIEGASGGIALSEKVIFDSFPELITIQEEQKKKTSSEEQKQIKEYENSLSKYYQNTKILNDEHLTLKDIYIDPGVSIFRHSLYEIYNDELQNVDERSLVRDLFINKYNITLNQLLKQWVELQGVNDFFTETSSKNVLFVLAYPGQGKTSSCYRLLYELIDSHYNIIRPIFFIKFRDIIESDLIITDPIKAIYNHLKENVVSLLTEETFYNSILILDGLDELEIFRSPIRSYTEYADKIVSRLAAYNYEEKTIKVIVTSRYYIDLAEVGNRFPIVSINEFTVDQQKSWLNSYTEFAKLFPPKISPIDIDEINSDSLVYSSLKELISQPILLQIIAIVGVYKDDKINKSQIYKRLFTDIVNKVWDNQKRPPLLTGLTPHDLRSVLQKIAFKIYYSGYQYLNKPEFIAILNQGELTTLRLVQTDEDLFRAMMIAFYFKKRHKSDSDDDYKIEFLHKSLSEYLSAEYIWEEIKNKLGNSGVKGAIFSEILFKVFSKFMPLEVISHLKEIINDDKSEQKTYLIKNINNFRATLYEKEFRGPNEELNDIKKSANVFYGYGNLCASLKMDMKADSNFEVSIYLHILDQYLQPLDLSYWSFYDLNLQGFHAPKSIIKSATFTNCVLDRASFRQSDLSETKFINCKLNFVDFYACILYKNDFTSSEINNFAPRVNNFINVNFSECTITDANFHESTLKNVSFDRSKLFKVSFEYTALKNVSFFNATVEKYSFVKVNNFEEVYGLSKEFLLELSKEFDTSKYSIPIKKQIYDHVKGSVPSVKLKDF
ncbi:hypothetical protein GCM10023189_36590 [Nibrella saemangeumensis]|uniref:NACHT domain-containing protein n=1 Tax=Nibrella saemangeumensis TaxID=1084526 RepID=A0ABP8N8X2_9BACT